MDPVLNELQNAIGERDKDEIKKIIDRLDHLPGASFDDTMVKQQRTEAFKHALRLDAFPIVEMLYDHWCGDLHWIGHDINKLKMLGKLLEDARVVCDVRNQLLLINIHSLITFNDFQQKLYSTLCREINSEAKNLVKVLSIYNEYSDLKNFRLPHEDKEQERNVKVDFEDESSEYMKVQAYIKYDVYYRKLDFNVALLILENLYILRQHLRERFNQPANQTRIDIVSLYKEIESALYHFIYRTSEDWRLYLPIDRQITTEENHTGIHKGRIINNLKITYDEHKLNNGPVLFLERKSFNKNLNELKIILEKHVINEDSAKAEQNHKQTKKAILNNNYLSSNMYMSDYYSLRKIVYYIEALEDTDDINVLMIERVLQVTGEMLKSTPESYHLSESTRSLLQIAMSVETIKYLQEIRNFLSKTGNGKLSIRIDIVNERANIFEDIKQDLKNIKQMINSVLDIYKPILDKSLLEKGLRLLDERIANMPDEASRHFHKIDQLYKIHREKLFLKSGTLFQELRAYTGLTTQLLKEVIWICCNRNDILSKIQLAKTTISEQVVRILPTYTQNIRQTLEFINENRRNVNQINTQLHDYKIKELPDDPKSGAISDRKLKVKNKKETVNADSLILLILNNIKDFSVHWEAIHNMLKFCLEDFELFAPVEPKLQIKEYDMATITNILSVLEDKCRPTSSCKNLAGKNSFGSIEKLHDIFKQDLPDTADTIEEKRTKLILCLISRVNLLKDTLQYPQHIPLEGIAPSDQHLRRYKHDKKFRFVLEMILADIANVLVECKLKRLMNKYAKLLREINLRNVLNHGDPFLEVIGDVFDSYDLSTGLLSKAIMFAKDGESIEALFKLIQDNIDYETIEKEKLENMNDGQKTLYERFQRSPNWESYVKLVPNARVVK